MKNFDDYMAIALNNEKKALRIIEQSLIIPAWEKAGAKVNLIGSLKTRTLAKHLDIDFHIYTPELNIARSFAVMAQIAANPHIKHIEFTNLADTDECCYEWHARFEDCDKALWQIDMIQILSGSRYDGYFEKQAENITAAMTEEMRRTILRLKFETPDNLHIAGIQYCKAVIQDGVRDMSGLKKWLAQHNRTGIIAW